MSGDSVGPAADVICCRVSGFSEALNWRPLQFEEPIVGLRLCVLCGVLSRRAVRLPCAHLLCAECHASCVQQGNSCPLDQKPFCEDELDQLELPVGFLEKRTVTCWNEPNGCNFTGLATSLLDHVRVCTFHAVTCPQCRLPVLRDYIMEHCRGGCKVHIATRTTHGDSIVHCQDTGREVCLTEKISKDLSALRASLDQLCKDVGATNAKTEKQEDDRTSKLAKKLDVRDAVCSREQKALREAVVDCRDQLSSLLRAQTDRLVAVTGEMSKSFLQLSESKTVHWYLGGWADTKMRALNGSLVSVSSSPCYMSRYKVSHFVQLQKVRDQVRFGCFLEIHPGRNDSELEWPFSKVFAFGIIHPKHKSVLSYKMQASEHKDQDCLQKPLEKRNLGLGTLFLCTAEKLDDDGFVLNDTLHLTLSVQP